MVLLVFCSMKSSIFSIVVVCFLFSFVFAQPKASSATVPVSANPFQEADWLFTFGEDAERDKQSLAVIERALASNGNDYQWQWRAARVYYYVGDAAGKTEKLPFFEKGMDTGRRAIAELPNAVEGHFWLAANYGGY
ncbi:MAG: hypothetical protein L0Y75_01170, partial [Acidobacteria bacterium]|nr:hypothetical protein [Acidobacteriota bacterium]